MLQALKNFLKGAKKPALNYNYSNFRDIKNDNHVLNDLLPRKSSGQEAKFTRVSYPYEIPLLKTDRPLRSLIYQGIRKRL